MLSAHWGPRFLHGGLDYVLYWRRDAVAKEQAAALPRADADRIFGLAFPRNWGASPAGLSAVGKLAAGLGTHTEMELHRLQVDDVRDLIHREIRVGRLLVLELRKIPPPDPPQQTLEQPAVEIPWDAPPPTGQTWIELEIVGEDAAPLAGVSVTIVDAEGVPRSLKSPGHGIVRLAVAEGDAQLTLPLEDGGSWSI